MILQSLIWRTRKLWGVVFTHTNVSFIYRKQRVLILRVDEIGDYILFRNTLPVYKKEWPQKKIILLGNKIWSDIYLRYDKAYVDKFIPLDKKKFGSGDIVYRFRILYQLWIQGINLIIQPTFSPDNINADIVLNTSAAKKISINFSMANLSKNVQKFYTKSFSVQINTFQVFEFYKNVEFVSKLFNTKFNLPLVILEPEEETCPQVCVCPGANRKDKQWPPEYFARVIKHIQNKYPQANIMICGSKSEINIADEILNNIDDLQQIQNITGKIGLVEFIQIISKSNLIISNDSAPVHIGAALNKLVICTYKGDHFGRFLPYPKEMHRNVEVLMPPKLNELILNQENHSSFSIADIDFQLLIEKTDKYAPSFF